MTRYVFCQLSTFVLTGFFVAQGCETPLHFACKFGHVDIVEFLVTHPLTDLNFMNKFGETPEQVLN